ncbi:MAG: PepSY-like domain-containing protein [Bacteroidetes Order II. Incertae sedis bacterium]|nr:PepSY-like domain-containing protein [Bacteroidetes Order II. bacterium]
MAHSSLVVPAEILRAFKKVFPKVDVSRVSWSWEVPHKIYEASFEQDGFSYEVEITVTGHHLLSEIYMRTEALPEGIRNHIEAEFPGAIIHSVERVLYSNGDVQYEIDLITGKGEREILVREDGYILDYGKDPAKKHKKVKEKEADEEEEEEKEETTPEKTETALEDTSEV